MDARILFLPFDADANVSCEQGFRQLRHLSRMPFLQISCRFTNQTQQSETKPVQNLYRRKQKQIKGWTNAWYRIYRKTVAELGV